MRALLAWLFICLTIPGTLNAAELRQETLDAWNKYVQLTEQRMSAELESPRGFLVRDFRAAPESARIQTVLASGKPYLAKFQTRDAAGKEIRVDDGIIHHRYGSIFVPGARMPDVLKWMQDYNQYHRNFKEVERSRLLSRNGDTFEIFLRLTRTALAITAHYNSDHTVTYRSHSNLRSSARMASKRIAEIEDAGSATEKELPPGKDSGYFLRANFYWRYQEEPGGTLVECESLTLTREIPFVLSFFIRGYVEAIPGDSLKDVLIAIREGLMAGRPTL